MLLRLLKTTGLLLLGSGLLLVLGLLLSAGALNLGPAPAAPAPQWAPDSLTVRVAAGPQYARVRLWGWLWGRHHRALWATPVTAVVLRLGPAGPAGLEPLQAGGSYQSRTLRLRSDDGRQFVLRSVDKDASGALPAGWQRRLLGGLMRDQTSAGHPYGAYAAARLAAAAEVLHTNPRLVYIGDERALGPYRPRYANSLYLLEERPDGDQRHSASLGFSPSVVGSAHLLKLLRTRKATPASARAYLRARLLDLCLGDWSRRPDQWRWALLPDADSSQLEFRPIPRDRDQAFFQFDDGLYPGLIARLRPRYQSFHHQLRREQVAGLLITGRPLDQQLLRGLARADFEQEAATLQHLLTDQAINQALQAGPRETRAAIAAAVAPRLRSRRDQLRRVAGWFWEGIMNYELFF